MMGQREFFWKKSLIILGCLLIFLGGVPALAAGQPGMIILTVGQDEAWAGTEKVILSASPQIIDGSTMVPLRFIGQSLGGRVDWQPASGRITIIRQEKVIMLSIGQRSVQVDHQEVMIDAPAVLVNGRTMVPLRFIAEMFGCQVDYQTGSKTIQIIQPNLPPLAEFSISGKTVAVGEAVVYQNLSRDPNGDGIAAEEWSGRQDSFDQPGIYQIQLRVRDSRGAWSEPFIQTIEVTEAAADQPVAQFSLDKESVTVGEAVKISDESFAMPGETITDRAWENKQTSFAKPGVYQIRLRVRSSNGFWSEWFSRNLEVLAKPNQPPLSRFLPNRFIVNQGETVIFQDESSDPDGDQITAYRWTGRQRAYFAAGPVRVTLEVKDQHGMWSAPFSIEIQVTNKVTMTELQFNLHNPLPGEIVNLDGLNVFNYAKLAPVSHLVDRTTLLISNSPETVPGNGILYRDTAAGSVRLMYSHKNGTARSKKFFILAANKGSVPVNIRQTQKGWSGPSVDELETGQAGLLRYLNGKGGSSSYLLPGKTIVLERGGNGQRIYPEECVYGMMDLAISGGEVTFSFVFAENENQAVTHYAELPLLAKDKHHRGTFLGANRTYRLVISDQAPRRFIFGDNIDDRQIYGIDAMTGERVVNKGNYGLVYTLQIHTDYRLGLLTNPRGGVFRGAGILPDGTTYGIPGSGLIMDGSRAVMNMVIEKDQDEELLFLPPAASNMPVSQLIIPF